MTLPELPAEIIAGLLALYDACGGSIGGRVQKRHWKRNFSSDYSGQADKIIKKCSNNPEGYVRRKPGRNMTYRISMVGIKALKNARAIP